LQKFTRPLTREIELGGVRLALTLSEQGIEVRTVGSRKPPWEISWPALVSSLVDRAVAGHAEPAPEALTAVLDKLKAGAPAAAAHQAPSPSSPPPSEPDTPPPLASAGVPPHVTTSPAHQVSDAGEREEREEG